MQDGSSYERGDRGREGHLAHEQIVREFWDEAILPHIPETLHETAEGILSLTIDMYSEPHRAYHTLEHIADCLRQLRVYSGRDDYMQLGLALLWHDVIYKTTTTHTNQESNEELSADFAVQMMELLELEGAVDVHRLIAVTELHIPSSEDEALLCDIDMSILAAPPEVYERYARGVRFEYQQYSDQQYNTGRLHALRKFEQPFHHPDFIGLTEAAFENVEREITLLESLTSQ